MIVAVAAACGRSVVEVAHDSFALTLYTSWHLEQHAQFKRWERQGERYDLGGLMGIAMHEPKELGKLHGRFIAEMSRHDEAASADSVAIARALKHVAQHQRMVSIPDA